MTYHYHAIPTIFFDCATGWDATHSVWADQAPDDSHSPLIGWALDGIPIYGPFSNGGTVGAICYITSEQIPDLTIYLMCLFIPVATLSYLLVSFFKYLLKPVTD